jgi:hypothetical protein
MRPRLVATLGSRGRPRKGDRQMRDDPFLRQRPREIGQAIRFRKIGRREIGQALRSRRFASSGQ